MTASAGLDCAVVTDRLIGGERPGSDAALAEHVGSCLTCFRVANDMKGLPQLRRQLVDVAEKAPDPGAVFWDAFPDRVAAAWQAHSEAATSAATAPTTDEVARWSPVAGLRTVVDRARGWFQLPVPAAFAGAALAAFIAVLIYEPRDRGRVAGSGAEDAPAELVGMRPPELGTTAGLMGGAPTAGSLVSGGAIDDSLGDLDVDELWRLRAGLERTLADEVGPGVREAEMPAQSDPAALSDELDELNAAGLAVLSEKLEKP